MPSPDSAHAAPTLTKTGTNTSCQVLIIPCAAISFRIIVSTRSESSAFAPLRTASIVSSHSRQSDVISTGITSPLCSRALTAASAGVTPALMRRRIKVNRAKSDGRYFRCEPASCVDGPRSYRLAQVRRVDGATPICLATAATVRSSSTTC